jgi:Flp pilus assembly protein TadD
MLRPRALYGMAQQGNGEISYYNTVMQHHRDYRVKMWHDNVMEKDKTEAVSTLIAALDATQQLKIMANDYQWEEMQDLIRQPVLTSKLEEACSVLRKSATTPEARDEIGFDWGRYSTKIVSCL